MTFRQFLTLNLVRLRIAHTATYNIFLGYVRYVNCFDFSCRKLCFLFGHNGKGEQPAEAMRIGRFLALHFPYLVCV